MAPPVRIPANPEGANGCQFAGFLHQPAAHHEEQHDGADLDGHHGVVGLRGLAHAAHQQHRQDHHHEEGGNVEVGAGPVAPRTDGARPVIGQNESERASCALR